MKTIFSRLTVFFDDPFWAALFERQLGSHYEACKIVFGTEPKDAEILEFINKNWYLLDFSPSVIDQTIDKKRKNPKRIQREISRHLQAPALGTKAQQALKLQHEQNKLERKTLSKAQREAEKDRQFQLRHEKRKQKHRGH